MPILLAVCHFPLHCRWPTRARLNRKYTPYEPSLLFTPMISSTPVSCLSLALSSALNLSTPCPSRSRAFFLSLLTAYRIKSLGHLPLSYFGRVVGKGGTAIACPCCIWILLAIAYPCCIWAFAIAHPCCIRDLPLLLRTRVAYGICLAIAYPCCIRAFAIAYPCCIWDCDLQRHTSPPCRHASLSCHSCLTACCYSRGIGLNVTLL